MVTIEEMATFCKRKGLVYPNSEIYGGVAGFFDFGHLGAELKNNLKQEWWRYHVHQREDIVGIDGSIIAHPKVWEASGHVSSFTDAIVSCTKCKNQLRGDHLIEDELKQAADGISAEEIDSLIEKSNIKCPKCAGELGKAKPFNLMFETNVGPVGDNKAYLRPETAQLIFTNFRLVADNARLKLPFGIAQMGRAFRNEISPRDFLFRCREFEQMEIEYFVHPKKIDQCPYLKEVEDYELLVYSDEMQEKKKPEEKMTVKRALEKKIIKTQWHAYWLAIEHRWFVSLGAKPDNFRIRQHLPDEKSHYALDTWDLEYKFPFGWKELQGMANRTDFDLQQHIKHSKKDLSLYEEEDKDRVVPHVVAEPSQGVERAFLVFLFDAYDDDKKRGNIVLHLHPKLAPVKAAVLPLVSNKQELLSKSKEIFDSLRQFCHCQFDRSGSIGRRYARQDEQGTPFCITIDFDTLEKGDVTIRDRDSTGQIRVPVERITPIVNDLIVGTKRFAEVKNENQ